MFPSRCTPNLSAKPTASTASTMSVPKYYKDHPIVSGSFSRPKKKLDLLGDDDDDVNDNDAPYSDLDEGFVSAVNSLAEEHTTEPMAIKYDWMTPESAKEPQPKTTLISTKWFKRWTKSILLPLSLL
jgi:hypothetical protein